MERNALGPMSRWSKEKLQNEAPMPFYPPKGWKSMHREVETSLQLFCAENKKLLRKFHTKKPTRKERELAFNGEFNERVTPST